MFTSQAGIKITDSDDLLKQDFRHSVWTYLTENNIARYPLPVVNRIPNFQGCGQCGNKLAKLPAFISAETIKVNPDKPQEEVRFWTLALRKKLLVPSPRLISGLFNLLENESNDDASSLRKKAQAEGVKRLSKPIVLQDNIKVDLIVIGSVAVSKTGRRIGKGEGFADLEYAMMKSMNAINDDVLVVTTVHDSQVFDDLPSRLFKEYDVPIDIIVTPTTIINVEHSLPKPKGIYWYLLSREKFKQVPVLKRLFKLEKEKNIEVSLMDGYCPSDGEDEDEDHENVDSHRESDIRPKTRRGQGRFMRQRGGAPPFHQHDNKETSRDDAVDSLKERDVRPNNRRAQGRSMRQRGGAPPYYQRANNEDDRRMRRNEDNYENREDNDSHRNWDQRTYTRRGQGRFMRGFRSSGGQRHSYNEDRARRDDDRYGNYDDVDSPRERDQRYNTRGGHGRFMRQRGGLPFHQDAHNEDNRENERSHFRERGGGRGRGRGWMKNSTQENSDDKTNIQVTINVDKQNHIVRREVEETNQQDRIGDADQNDSDSPRSSGNNNFSIFVGGIPKNSLISDLRDELLTRNVKPTYIAWKVVGFAFLNFYSYPNTVEEVMVALNGLALYDTLLKYDIDRKHINKRSDRNQRTENAEFREDRSQNSGYAEDRTSTRSQRWKRREPVNRPNNYNRDDSRHNDDDQGVGEQNELSIGHFKPEPLNEKEKRGADQRGETSVQHACDGGDWNENTKHLDSTSSAKSPINRPDKHGGANAGSTEPSKKKSEFAVATEQKKTDTEDCWGAENDVVDATNSAEAEDDGWGSLSDDGPTEW